jgi:hypothetical protein
VKAHHYLYKAMGLAPQRPEYRDALFEFLLSTTDCSRTGLREAAGMLSAVPQSDPNYNQMSWRLEDERCFRSSAGERLASLFLVIPRATYSMAALSGAVLTDRGATSDRRDIRRGGQENAARVRMRRTRPAPAE